MKSKIECQENVLSILATNPHLVNSLAAARVEPVVFDPVYRPLLYAIYDANARDLLLTENGLDEFVHRSVANGDYAKWTEKVIDGPKGPTLAEKQLFNRILSFALPDKNDFEFYLRQLKEWHARDRSNLLFEAYQAKLKNGTFIDALSELAGGLQSISHQNGDSKAKMIFVDKTAKEFMERLRKRREHPEEKLLMGFPELDEAIGIGLAAGGLTLFVADVGGFKSAMMLNIALNIFKRSKKHVLFVSLEIPEEQVKFRILAREVNIKLHSIANPEKLTDEEVARIEAEWEKWNVDNKFVILDATDDRLSVADIKASIETHVSFFKPEIVVVDYISILAPEKWYIKQQSHEWVGHMCKGLRQLGRKHGFHAISAAQLGREAIKRLKSQKDGQQTVGSEDLRGSHEFSADADNIFVLVPHPTQPNQKLLVFGVKCRNGDKSFGGKNRIELDVRKEYGQITSAYNVTWNNGDSDNDYAIKHSESIAATIDFDNDLALDDFDVPAKPVTAIKTPPVQAEKKMTEKQPGRKNIDLDLEL